MTAYSILFGISFSHTLNDAIQSIIPSIYPLIKDEFTLSFEQIGVIQLTYQMTASVLQPAVGSFTDNHPKPFSLAVGMCLSMFGLIFIAFTNTYSGILLSAALIGIGSSIFHPESSKLANMASGGRRGLAQSIFSVGGNVGSAVGPLLVALIVVKYGRSHVSLFSLLSLIAILILLRVGKWTKMRLVQARVTGNGVSFENIQHAISQRNVKKSLIVLFVLIFSKYIYLASISSYFTFFLIEKYHVSVQSSQLFLFGFLFSCALGTLLGGPLGDKYGRRYVIWFSILGAAPFAMVMGFVNSLFWTSALSVVVGLVLSSAFPAIIVYAQELVPGKVGAMSGLFYGLSFGVAGIGAAVLGVVADHTSIFYVFHFCSFLLVLGLFAYFLPDLKMKR